jgi:branched-chain amino acid transport system ATP-binding protein
VTSRRRHDQNAAVLEVRDVAVQFGAVQALDGVSLTVRPGQFVGLIGPNGAGKTTCFNVISGFVPAARGRVRLDGRRVTGWPPAQRARAGLARTFQNIGLDKAATVADNLRVASEGGPLWGKRSICPGVTGLPPVAELLERLELTDVLSARADELPIGTAKLVELACALGRQPRVLLLDEPSSGLGPPERRRLGEVLRDLHEQSALALLMIEHDMALAMSTTDQLYVLNFGTLLCEGTPAQVRSDPAVIDAYLGGAA